MSDDFDREEQAFRDAFRSAVESESFRPLDPGEIRTAAGPTRRLGPWAKGLAAAAAVVLVVGGAGVVLPRMFLAGAGSTADAPTAAAGGIDQKDMTGANEQPLTAVPAANPMHLDWVVTAQSPLSARLLASGAWADGRFYLVGGRGLPDGCRSTDRSCAPDHNTLLDGASYEAESDTWALLPDSPAAVAADPPVVVGATIYFWSDTVRGTEPVRLLALDTTTSTWSEPALPSYPGQLVAVGESLVNVAPGGGPALDQAFDTSTGTWTDLPADPLGASQERVGTGLGENLILATRAGPGSSTRLAELDLASGNWQVLPASRVAGTDLTTVGEAVVVEAVPSRDQKGSAVGDRYDVASGTWSTIPGPDFSSHLLPDASGAVAGDWLLLQGNLFNVADGSWAHQRLPHSRSLWSATAVGSPGGLLIFGGEDGDSLSGDTYYLPIS